MPILQNIIQRIQLEPVLFQGFIQALVPLLLSFGIIRISDDQVGSLYVFMAAVLSFVTRNAVTPLVKPRDELGHRLTPEA